MVTFDPIDGHLIVLKATPGFKFRVLKVLKYQSVREKHLQREGVFFGFEYCMQTARIQVMQSYQRW